MHDLHGGICSTKPLARDVIRTETFSMIQMHSHKKRFCVMNIKGEMLEAKLYCVARLANLTVVLLDIVSKIFRAGFGSFIFYAVDGLS